MKTKLLTFLAILLSVFAQAQTPKKPSELTTGTITGPSLLTFSLPSGSSYVDRKATFAEITLALETALDLGGAASLEVGTSSGTVAAGNHTHAFSALTGTPTTLAGYGITDGLQLGATSSTAAAGNHTHTATAIGAEAALGNPTTNGYVLSSTTTGVRSWVSSAGTGTVTSIAYAQPAAGFTLSGGTITGSGTWTFALANDLAALEALSGTGYASRTGSETWSLSSTIPATDLSGTIADARFPATLPAVSGANLTGLTAANITASTATGRNILNITNPGVIAFNRINADNTVSTRTAAQLLSDIGGAASSGLGTMSTQGAGAVAITGGTASGITLNNITLPVSAQSGATFDFAGDPHKTYTMAGATTFFASNWAAGKSITVKITGGGSAYVPTFPTGWKFVGAVAPTSIAAGKVGILTVTSFGTTDANCVAAWSVEP